jgi:hypothetical protein
MKWTGCTVTNALTKEACQKNAPFRKASICTSAPWLLEKNDFDQEGSTSRAAQKFIQKKRQEPL